MRLAMGWNGGVSLAVWMGGAAVEFDCARRAHLGPEPVRAEADAPVRRVYHALCSAFGRRLVLDIFAGASAGGVNSALLAAAISRARRLHPDFLRARWLELGDFSKLLQSTSSSKPPSLMRGELFLDAVQIAFRQLMVPPAQGTDAPDPCAVPDEQKKLKAENPALEIQVTNVGGRQHLFPDEWGHELVAAEYRAPFRFRGGFDPLLLAQAARASASFPAAFEPLKIDPTEPGSSGLQPRWFAIDGGLLENAPIKPAIDLIPSRPASGPVKRIVCYVNAAPTPKRTPDLDPEMPTLRDVLGYVVNLPRDGRFIDQIYAIQEAERRSRLAADTVSVLVDVEQAGLRATADALLPTYRKRRALLSLEELLAKPDRPPGPETTQLAERVLEKSNDGLLLPWVPSSLDPPRAAGEWRWGIRAAERCLHLQLDLLRGALPREEVRDQSPILVRQDGGAVDGATADAIEQIVYAARQPIDDAIGKLEAEYGRFLVKPGLRETTEALVQSTTQEEDAEILDCFMEGFRGTTFARLRSATESFYGAVRELLEHGAFSARSAECLLGSVADEALSDDAFAHFLQRALSIEVVRRAIADDRVVDAAQTLHFGQLTPTAPVRIFTRRPVNETGPADGEDKLTGTRLGHFAGFYRASWRANDFMWGRLDAAGRLVDLLVDDERARRIARHLETPSARQLAGVLVPDGDEPAAHDQRTLIREALLDAKRESKELSPKVVDFLERRDIPSADESPGDLRQILEETLTVDLQAVRGGFFTRVVCARAAQYEILREELGVLVEQTAVDADLGSFTKPLGWDTSGSLLPIIEELRDFGGEHALPRRLGRDSADESTSTLAIRTISRTALVALAALPGISMPLARLFLPARTAFLATAGVTSRRLLEHLAVVLAFVAAALYVTARVITADNANPEVTPLGSIWSPPVWAMGIALLTIAGVAAIPIWRLFRGKKQRLSGAAWTIGLLATGGAVAVIAGLATIGFAATITGYAGFEPNRWAVGLTFLAAGLGVVGLRQGGRIQKLATSLEKGWWVTPVLVGIASGLLGGWSLPHVFHAVDDGGWHPWAAVLALASPLPVAGCVLWPDVKRLWVRLRASTFS